MSTEALDLPYTLHLHTGKFSRYEICHLQFRHYFLFPDERQAKRKIPHLYSKIFHFLNKASCVDLHSIFQECTQQSPFKIKHDGELSNRPNFHSLAQLTIKTTSLLEDCILYNSYIPHHHRLEKCITLRNMTSTYKLDI